MANRAYLYTSNKEQNLIYDVSEFPWGIPIFYKILLGVDTCLAESKIWNYEHPIAIKADFKLGLQRLYDFYDYLETQKELNKKEISNFKNETIDFFKKNKERVSDLFFMEATEIYELGESENWPIEKSNKYEYDRIKHISMDISEILVKRPINVFDSKKDSPSWWWLKEIKEDINSLSVYWTHETYFSMNNYHLA